MGIKHPVTVSSGDKLYSPDWNAEHIIDSDIDFAGFSGVNVGEPVNASDIATKNYVDSQAGGGAGLLGKNIYNSSEFSVWCEGNRGWYEIGYIGSLITSSKFSGIMFVKWSGKAKVAGGGVGGIWSYSQFRYRIVGKYSGITYFSKVYEDDSFGLSQEDIYYSFEFLEGTTGYPFYDTEYEFYVDARLSGTTEDKYIYYKEVNFEVGYLD